MNRNTSNPAVIRVDFQDQQAWEAVRRAIETPAHEAGYAFQANLEFVQADQYRDYTVDGLLGVLPTDYQYGFLFVVDRTTLSCPGLPVLVVGLRESRGRTFRALPSQIQGIENNLSVANMDFAEFESAVDKDGVFRGF